MPNNDNGRRDFLKSAFGLAVVAAGTPTVLLGRITPVSVRQVNKKQAAATYVIDLNDLRWECVTLPNGRKVGLTEVGCSVRLEDTTEELAMNPDFCEKTGADGTDYPIAVTRVKESGEDAFTAVSTWCPHNQKGSVTFDHRLGDNGVGLFLCSHEDSCFRADGTWVPPEQSPFPDAPAADQFPDQQNLNTFPCTYDETTNTITIGEVLVDCEMVSAVNGSDAYYALDQNSPNPVRMATLIRFALPAPARTKLELLALDGSVIATLVDGQLEAGSHTHELHARHLTPGTYVYRLDTPFGVKTRKMVVVK